VYWENRMLSFELSAIDLILAIAVIILLVLYITRLSARPPAEDRRFVGKESSSEKRVTEAAVPDEEGERPVSAQPKSQTGSATCPFGFGYLSKLDRKASIPDGCLRCSRVMECCSAGE
jgi:hypothetical protein